MRQQTTVGQSKKKQSSIPVASKTTKEEKLRLAMEEPDKKKRKDSGSNPATIKHRPATNESLPVDDAQAIDHEFYLIDEEQYNTNMESMYDARRKRQQIFDQSLIPEVDQQSNDVRKKRHQFLNPAEVDQQYSDEDFLPIDDLTLSDDDKTLNMNDVLNKQFSASDFDDTAVTSNTRVNFSDTWILLWIFKYQSRFQLSDSAIDALIKFFKLVLSDVDKNRFDNFPSSAYMAKKLMGFVKKSKVYVICPECNKLFNPTEVISTSSADSSTKCNHVEFPNHPMRSQRKSCNTDLLKKVPISKGYIWRPIMIYPLPCLKTQLVALYQRAGFEELLRKWTNRGVNQGLMFDIYDGDIWKTFPSQHDIPDPSPFFTPESADSHLGIMLNLDWFQLFDSRTYSCGVIYGVICNLPRDIRFKKENMLTL
ncbi:hypothetical protein RhiirC2_775896, partial [Rhizophagus irregularis]